MMGYKSRFINKQKNKI